MPKHQQYYFIYLHFLLGIKTHALLRSIQILSAHFLFKISPLFELFGYSHNKVQGVQIVLRDIPKLAIDSCKYSWEVVNMTRRICKYFILFCGVWRMADDDGVKNTNKVNAKNTTTSSVMFWCIIVSCSCRRTMQIWPGHLSCAEKC